MAHPFQSRGLIFSSLCLYSVIAYDVIFSTISTLPITQPASFNCRISSLWTSERHPQDYPSDATFEVPIVVSHGTAYEMFNLNELASTGLQEYTETGVTKELELDIIAAYDKTDAIKDVKKGVDMPLSELTSFRLNGLAVDESRYFISAVTRLSPSPDWFTGLNAFSTQQDGFWFNEFEIETWALDAGTSTGNTYNDPPIPESPTPQNIQQIPNGVFGALPVAMWRCVLTTTQFDPQEIAMSPVPITEVSSSLAPSKAPALSLTTDMRSDLPSTDLSDAPSTTPATGTGTGTDIGTGGPSSGALHAWISFAAGAVVVLVLMI